MIDYLDQPESGPAGLVFINANDPRRGPKVGGANERHRKVGPYVLTHESEDGVIGYYIRTKEPFHPLECDGARKTRLLRDPPEHGRTAPATTDN